MLDQKLAWAMAIMKGEILADELVAAAIADSAQIMLHRQSLRKNYMLHV